MRFYVAILVVCLLVPLSAQTVLQQSNYDVVFYKIDLHVNNNSTFINGHASIKCRIEEESDTLIFDLGSQLQVDSVLLNDSATNYNHVKDQLFILSEEFEVDTYVTISIYYEGDGNDEQVEGALFNKSYLDYGNFTYSLTEPYSSKYWYPTKQVLTDKADSVFVYLTIPKGLKAGSNGLLTEIIEVNDSLIQYRWESRYPTAFYLISLAVGDYFDYTFYSSYDTVYSDLPVVNYIYNSEDYLEVNKSSIDTTSALLRVFSELFVPYPFSHEKYGHCTAPLGGGMEHQTMTTLGSFGFDLVAHELAHQWFGNYVTCTSWNDIWINEGFASYCEYLAHEFLEDEEGAFAWMERTQNLALNSDAGSVYIPDDELESTSRIFDYKSTYKKGASIIHMLRYELDDDSLFFDVLNEFITSKAYGNGSVPDLLETIKTVTGNDYNWFFTQWYYGSGYPIFSVDWYQRGDSLTFLITQNTSQPESISFFQSSLDIKILGPTGDSTIRLPILSPETKHQIVVDMEVYDVIVDPDNFLLKEVERIGRVDSLMAPSRFEILVFPNPTKDSVQLYSLSNIRYASITLLSIDGKKLKAFDRVDTNGGVISLGDIGAGIYLLDIDIGSTNTVVKLIKS